MAWDSQHTNTMQRNLALVPKAISDPFTLDAIVWVLASFVETPEIRSEFTKRRALRDAGMRLAVATPRVPEEPGPCLHGLRASRTGTAF